MKRPISILVSLLAVAASCGGEIVERGDANLDGGAGSDSDAAVVDEDDGSALADTHDATDAGADESVSIDSSDRADGPQLPPCHEDRDCDGIASCQSGYCCDGTFATASARVVRVLAVTCFTRAAWTNAWSIACCPPRRTRRTRRRASTNVGGARTVRAPSSVAGEVSAARRSRGSRSNGAKSVDLQRRRVAGLDLTFAFGADEGFEREATFTGGGTIDGPA